MTAAPKSTPPLTPERIRELCLDFESEQVERTRAFDKADKIGQAICAFANDLPGTRRPGYLLLGVENDGTVSGRRISEIANPGGLFGRANPENFPFVSDYRNPLLAEAMKVLGFVNRFNRGIATVRDELAQNGNPPAVFDVNKRTEFRVTVRAAAESGAINPESGAINPESGTINGGIKPKSGGINPKSGGIKPKSGGINPESGGINSESGGINPESGGINPHHPEELDSAIFNLIGQQSGIKRDGIFLIVKTSLRSVERSLARLRDAGKIEYRGSKRTGGWFVRT